MRVAFLSDIHANHPALTHALASAERHGAAEVVIAGDLVGNGPHPSEVVRLLQERSAPAIRGNVDRKVLRAAAKSTKTRAGKKKKDPNVRWTAKQLGPEELSWLEALPRERTLEFNGVRVRVVHGSPRGDTDYIYPSITPEGLRAKLGDDRPGVLVCGHSHVPFTKLVEGVRVVNCGSVGRPADGDPRGSYALVDFSDPEKLWSGIVRFPYPVEQVVTDLEARKVPEIDASEYREGVKTD